MCSSDLLLRRGTASGYAEVDFVALNGCRYRSRWSVSRAWEKESGRLQSARLTLYNIDAGKEEPGTNKDLQARIIELIGLTFDQFTRSVLLAQNDFSTFLKAEQGEKASLLEKLTNEWDGLTHDYTRKGGVVHAEIMLPAHAPPEFADRSTLCNSVEQIEKARDSQLAREKINILEIGRAHV